MSTQEITTVSDEPTEAPTWTPQPGKALMLRTSHPDGRSSYRDSFIWPATGPVEAPDWDPAPHCGHGLHGLLWGAGDAGSITVPGGLWQVVEVDAADVVTIGGKVKVPRGVVVYSGERSVAVDLVSKHAPAGTLVHWGTATAGDGGTATAGDGGTATAGYGGTATAGDGGTATAGYGGTATAGDGGTATAGYGGLIAITWWNEDADECRRLYGIVGQDGIEAGVAYRVEAGTFVRAAAESEASA